MVLTILLLLSDVTAGQVPVPCGNSPQHPCYVTADQPGCISMITAEAEAYEQLAVCRADLKRLQDDERGFTLFNLLPVLCVLAGSLLLWVLGHVDTIAAAMRRSELPWRKVLVGVLYFASVLGLGLFLGAHLFH